MTPLIIESHDPEEIDKYLSEKYYLGNVVSELRPENDSIGLPAIKFFIDRTKFTYPRTSESVFLIRDGHLITPAGQNALLKTLEESKPQEQFIITTINHYLLLPTICSRCQIIRLDETGTSLDKKSLSDFITAIRGPMSGYLVASDNISKKNPTQTLNNIISHLCSLNRQLPTSKRIKIISYALTCLNDLDHNINPKLAIDHFLFKSGKLVRNALK